jgi:hypothetical protein
MPQPRTADDLHSRTKKDESPGNEEVRAELEPNQNLIHQRQSVIVWTVFGMSCLSVSAVLYPLGTMLGGSVIQAGYATIFGVLGVLGVLQVSANLDKGMSYRLLARVGHEPSVTLDEVRREVINQDDSEGRR